MALMTTRKDLLSHILFEAQAYKSFEDIEKLVDGGADLSMIPIQPLYVSLRSTSKEQLAHILPKLSFEQRQALIDIDLWKKDEVDVLSALYWLEVYSMCTDEKTILEFVKSEQFLLSLKNQFTVQTFDVEDPQYPENDNYFLTEDNLLLIEYPEDFQYVQELKNMIKVLYSELGVEKAYAFLFKMLVDSYQMMEEENYQEKKERLRDFGFVDYFESLEFNNTLPTIHSIDQFITNKKIVTGNIDNLSLNQSLHASTLVAYQSGMDDIKDSLSHLKNEKRQHFLQFNFIRLVNAQITFEDALKNGSMAMSRVGNQTKQCLELGFQYVKSKLESNRNVFEVFDFVDLFKVGHSLLEVTRKKIKKSLVSTPFEKDDFAYFLGMYWNGFIENSYLDVVKYKFDGSSQPKDVSDLATYQLWNSATDTFLCSIPFIERFLTSFNQLMNDGVLNDQFYLNYDTDNIDFEAIIISSFINDVGGFYQTSSAGKMGVTINELKNFYHQFFNKKGNEYLIKGEEDPILREKASNFMKKFGLDVIIGFDKYLYQIMLEQLNGYEIDNMSEEDFKHVGGPILLNYVSN